MTQTPRRVQIVGGGPAGLMAGITPNPLFLAAFVASGAGVN